MIRHRIASNRDSTAIANGNWWGAVDGPGGALTGSGDEVSTGVTVDDYLSDGSEFSYANGGTTSSEGTIAVTLPPTQGTSSTEWGTGATTSI